MEDRNAAPIQVSRITCCVHHQLSARITERLRDIGVASVVAESGRTVRRRRTKPRFGKRRQVVRVEDSPVDVLRVSVALDAAREVTEEIVRSAQMEIPGRGTVFTQDAVEHAGSGAPARITAAPADDGGEVTLLSDLTLMTFVLSTAGSGERVAEVALELGTGVPIITYGTGTGIRDRLGLLRITVPPEKELVHLLVPAADTDGLLRQLIEENSLNRPGSGFVFCTAVREGLLDTRLLIGPQEHAATMEQVVAAIDKLSAGAGWRRRFSDDDGSGYRLIRDHTEISMLCPEELLDRYVDAAREAGAMGATVSRVRQLSLDGSAAGDAARARCVMCVPTPVATAVVAALQAADGGKSELDSVQTLGAPTLYSFQSQSPSATRS